MHSVLGAAVLAATLGIVGHPPWLRPPPGWVIVEKPPGSGAMRILAMWRDPTPAALAQNISLGIQRFKGDVETYARATGRTLNAGPVKPTLFEDLPFSCASGPARLLVYETKGFGPPAHFEQILVKRADDVYVATYTRGIDQTEDRAAASALRRICR